MSKVNNNKTKEKIKEYELSGWYMVEKESTVNKYRIKGKYLFYSTDFEKLIEIAKIEIKEYGFEVAKVILPKYKIMDEYVMCLYDVEEKKEKEMIERFKSYQASDGVRYWRWKSDEETRRGEYEK